MLLFIEENAVTAVDLMLPQVVERVVLRPPHTVFVLVLTLFHTFAMDVLILLNTELAVDFTEFQAVESEDLMLFHFVEVSVLIFDHAVEIVDFRLLQVVLASVLTFVQVVESEVLMFVHAVEVFVLTLSHAVEMVVFMLFQTVLAVDLIPSQVVERKLLMLPHTVEAVLLMAFQASEQTCLIPSNFSEKNSTMLCQVSAIPCRRPSIRKVPISAKAVAEQGFELAMEKWEQKRFPSVHIDRCNNHLFNAINESPNATLNINGTEGFTAQELELIDLYRNFPLRKQMELLNYAFSLKEGKQ